MFAPCSGELANEKRGVPGHILADCSMKNVLVIAYVFPPIGGGGVQRTLKFVKYLPSFGWRPVVLTPKQPIFDYFDHTLVDEIPPEAKIYKTASLEPPRWYTSIIERYFATNPAKDSQRGGGSWYGKTTISLVKPIFKVVRWVAHNLVFVPDTQVGWIPFAVWRGLNIVRRERIDAIYATGNPWSDFLIAFFVSRLTGKPFIMDMRDPWTLSPDVRHGRVRSSIERFWERRCIRAAFKVINITEQVTQAYRERYPDVEPSKFQCITQGFDPPDFEGVQGIGSDKFTIAATGTYYAVRRTPESFLKALRSLVDRNPDVQDQVCVRFMGTGGQIVKEFVEKYNLSGMAEVLPYGTHQESIRLVLSSDVLLLDFLANVDGRANLGSTSSRIFEYLASGKPILGLVYKTGAAAEIILSTGSGIVADPEDTEEVAQAIHTLFLQHKAGTLGVEGQHDLERFTRKSLTGSLAQMLGQAVASKS